MAFLILRGQRGQAFPYPRLTAHGISFPQLHHNAEKGVTHAVAAGSQEETLKMNGAANDPASVVGWFTSKHPA